MKANTEKKRPGRPPRIEDEGALEPRTFRFSQRAWFAVRLLARQTARSPVEVLEELILREADAEIGGKLGRHWLELYDADEGVASLTLLANPRYRPDADEEQLSAFVAAHAPFFYADDERKEPHRERVAVLWPNDKTAKAYARSWYATRSKDVWGVAREMAAALKAAGASVPAGRGKW